MLKKWTPYLTVCISWRFPRFESNGESKISDDCSQVITQQYILTLEVPVKSSFAHHLCYKHRFAKRDGEPLGVSPVCNGRFGALSLVAGNVFVEVGQATRHRLRYVTQLIPGYSVTLQMVRQRALPARKGKVQFNNSYK